MEYLQLNRVGVFNPTPIMFVYREIGNTEITLSLHFEDLPYEALHWFLEYVDATWSGEVKK